MLTIDLTGKHALVAGVADDGGFGFAIAKALAEAGAKVSVGTWPPALGIFKTMLERGKLDASRAMRGGGKLEFAKIYPLDAEFDRLEDVPAELRDSRRYRDLGDFTIGGLAAAVAADGGVDIVVHSLANGSEVKKPLLETSRKGYLSAVSASECRVLRCASVGHIWRCVCAFAFGATSASSFAKARSNFAPRLLRRSNARASSGASRSRRSSASKARGASEA
jgi:enoyl-[acyl-carrier-protein] reductase (NADH)